MKKVLIVGSGGREHALAWKLAPEAEIFACPGNPGIATLGTCLPSGSHQEILAHCRDLAVDLVVVGPEDPLIAGLADTLREAGVLVYGPGRAGAILEASKSYSKSLMIKADIPTAGGGSFNNPGYAIDFAESLFLGGSGVVVKASGNALGKGVLMCPTLDEAQAAISRMMEHREFGEAGETVVIEEWLPGREFSLLTLVSGRHYHSLPVAQDYKRAFDGDEGPNTGGMGTYSPVPWVTPEIIARTEQEIVEPTLRMLRAEGIDYRGTLFTGVMVVDDQPYCLEYNVRFGDPETQSVMRRLGSGFLEALLACARGERIPVVEVLENAAITVVLAAEGYPGTYAKGVPLDISAPEPGVVVFHAGTAIQDGQLVSSGGRVLGVSAAAESIEAARTLAYQHVDSMRLEGIRWREDIGTGQKLQ